MGIWTVSLILLAVAALVVLLNGCLLPLRHLRKVVGRLAAGDYSPVLLSKGGRSLRRIAHELDTIRERLIEQRQRLHDEVFSLQAILSSMSGGVLIADDKRRVRMINTALADMFQIRTSPVNKSVMEVFHSVPLHEATLRALDTGLPQTVSLTYRTETDFSIETGGTGARSRVKHFEVNVVALDSAAAEDRHLGLVAVFHDITELREQQTARQELMANVSHELCTPLSIISGYIETMLDDGLDDPALARHFLSTMQKHSERLRYLIDDMMTISRMESQSPGLALSEVNISECVQRVVERLDARIRSTGAEVHILPPVGGRTVRADPDRMDQVFFNLLDNAIKYCVRRQPVIEIAQEYLPGRVRISVSDNGPGIAPEHRPYIFDRFYRAEKDRSRDSGGTGLGLAIVKNVVLAHGGTVAVGQSSLGGARFIIVLPTGE